VHQKAVVPAAADPELYSVAQARSGVPEAIRAGIVAMLRAMVARG
jgi:hypothetical protein